MSEKRGVLDGPTMQRLKDLETKKDLILSGIAKKIRATTMYYNMNPVDREICIRHIVRQSSTQWDLRRELKELGVEHFDVAWADIGNIDKVSARTSLLAKVFGRLVSKNGALVTVTTIEKIY